MEHTEETRAEAMEKVVYCPKCSHSSVSSFYGIYDQIWCRRFGQPMGYKDFCSRGVDREELTHD